MVAGGVRITWDEVPQSVRRAVEEALGAPVVSTASQPGGFSPGSADRVLLADGRTAFVKTAGTALNPMTPDIHRREIRNLQRLPAGLPVPRLLASMDDGDWVALVVEEIPGRHPHEPWQADDLQLVQSALDELASGLTPAPDGFPTVWEHYGEDLTGWSRLAADPPGDLDDWSAQRLDRLLEIEASQPQVLAGDTLQHVDLRADNLLIVDGPAARAVVIDWPGGAVGAPWIDTAGLAFNVAFLGGADPEDVLRGTRPGATADPDHVTAFLVGVAGYFAWSCRQPPPTGLPTVRAFQRAQGDAVRRWLSARGV